MTETTNPRIEQMDMVLRHAIGALEKAEGSRDETRAMWQMASDNALHLASTLALASIAESLASIDLTLVQLNGIVLQAEDDLNRLNEAVEAMRPREA